MKCNVEIFFFLLMFGLFFAWPVLICFLEWLILRVSKHPAKWKRPGLKVNPFKNRKPLQFWWTFYIGMLCAAFGAYMKDIIAGIEINELIYGYIAAGLGGLAGIRASLYLFNSSFEQPDQIGKRLKTEPQL